MQTPSKVLNQLKILETLHLQGGSTPMIEQTLEKIIVQALALAQARKAELDRDLQQFESQYQLSSEEFERRFQSGSLGDGFDFVEWDAFYQLSRSIQRHIDLLSMTGVLA
jgi:hypothetical protein